MSGDHVQLTSPISLLLPPYDAPKPITRTWRPLDWPQPGAVLVWSLLPDVHEGDFEFLKDRLPGLPLFLVLPPPSQLEPIREFLQRYAELRPRAILPAAPLLTPEAIRGLLVRPRRPLSAELSEYLVRRGLLPSRIRPEVGAMFAAVGHVQSITQLCKRMYTSRRTLGRHFEAERVPPPSHWLQMARLLHVALRLQKDRLAIFRAAIQAGYPDGFTMSNQMKRLLGCRPSDVREAPGWEWLVESWIRCEVARNGFSMDRFSEALSHYRLLPPKPLDSAQ